MPTDELITIPADPRLVARLKFLSRVFGLLVACTAVVVLIGWVLNLPILKSINPSFVSMKANTAICFLLIGFALWFLPDNNEAKKNSVGQMIVRACCGIIILTGFLTLVEYVSGRSLGIDQLFFQDIGAVQTFSPGRMAANTALCFCLIGFALLRLDHRDEHGQYPAQYLMLIVGFISLLSIIGYWYHVDAFYGLLQYSKMALHTAVLFALCFFGVLFARPTQGLMLLVTAESAGGLIVRRLALFGSLSLLLIGWLRIEGQRAGFYDTSFGASLYAIVGIIVIMILLWLTAAQLYDQDLRRRQISRQLIKTKNEAEANGRLKELLLDILRHDLLGPAGVVKTSLDMVLLKEMPEENRRKFLQLAENSNTKVIEMIESAKIFAKVESAADLLKEPADLNEIFQAVANSFKTLLLERKIVLNYLPQGEKKAAVNQMIENVFANLISNAIKYSPEGRKIEVDIVDKGSNWQFYVKDWGDGITDEDKATLFTRFRRVDKKGVKGTGLGLAIIKRIVELHAGRIWIENNPEGGSIFFVEIPKG